MINNDGYLKKLRNEQLSIIDEIKRICDKNNIPYFLLSGTLLGAVRHKGYIPWDDDADIGMLRSDYNRFLNICKKDLDDKYYVDYYLTNTKYWLTYAKIKKKNTIFLEKKFMKFNKNQEIFIDIFPFDNVDNIDDAIEHNKLVNKYHTLLSIKLGLDYYKNSKIKKTIYKVILFLVPTKYLTNKIVSCMDYNKNEKSKYLSVFNTQYGLIKDTYNRNIFFPLKELEFEGRMLKVPNDYDAMLKQLFKDYMKLPPKDKRVTHNPLMVKFEDGTIYERIDNKMVKKK